MNHRGYIFVVLTMLATSSNGYAQFESNSLSQAVDNTQANFITDTPGFFRQTSIFTTGCDAAQSGVIGDDGLTLMIVEVNGPTTVSFDWKVSSEEDFDFLVFDVFDENINLTGISREISGTTDFQRVTINIPAGTFFPTWSYEKDGSISDGQDSGWVDNIVIGNLDTIVGDPDDDCSGVKISVTPAILHLLLSDN